MKYTFKELIDVPKLQELTDELYTATSIPSAIVAMDGEIITGSGWQKICTDFHRKHPQIEKECIESDTIIRKKLDDGEPFVIYKCPRGLVDASSPIIIAGEHVANVFSGQVFLELCDETTERFFREQARKFGFDEAEYIKAFKKVPIFEEEKFRAGISFLAKLAQSITNNGLTRLRELEATEALRESEEKFRSLAENQHDVVWTVNENLEVDYISPSCFKMTGTTAEETIGKNPNEFYTEESYQRVIMKLAEERQKSANEIQPGVLEVEQYHEDGHLFPVEITCMPVIIDNKFVGVQGITRDITERKNAEKALRESQEKYRALFSNAQVALFRTRISDGKLVQINESYAKMAGYSTVEYCMAEFNAADAWANPNARNELLRILKENGSVNDFETEIILRNGSRIWILFSATIFPEQGFLEGSIVDINERKQAEDALRESEAQKQALLDGTPDMIIQIDTNMKVLWANSVALTVKTDIVGMTCYKGFINKDNPCEGCACKRAIETGNIESSIMYHPAAEGVQGESYWELIGVPLKNDAGEITGAIEIARNITDRKQAEETLRESKVNLDKAQEIAHVGSWRRDLKRDQGYWSDEMYRVLGLTPGDPQNPSRDAFLSRVHPADRERIASVLKKVIEKKKPFDFEYRTISIEGSERIIHSQGEVVCDETETPVVLQGTNRDMTERRRLQDQLQEAQKMEAIATLAGGVAHEFNNALMGIMGNIELLKMDLPEDERRDRYFEAMKGSSHRMSRLTDQLLAYAEGGKYQPKNLRMDDFVIETLPILQHDLSPAVRVETHFQKDIWYINADNAQMQMLLSAILANSNEAIEDVGLIRIVAENKDVDEDFIKQHAGLTAGLNLGLKPGPYVCLTVEDDGKGMDEETRNGIFEPFFTTKFQGRGMGMAAVHGIVMNHNGWIYVESEFGKGTTVQIYLPAIEIEVEKPKKTKAEATTGTGTILMIEDEDVVVEVTQAMLEMLGYRVMVAKTGKDAIHIAETSDGQIDLALLDIKLPDIDGRNLYPLIMKARPDLKVVVFSGYSIDGPAREILDAGAQDFIQKPFSIATLSEKLKEVLEGK